jgi:hypothetical protein
MRKTSLKGHLKPYSIFNKRRTTINHAFASALAPNDQYDETVIDDALRVLGQNPDDDLECVYCGREAETWDHLIGLVKNSQLRGYGHQIGNLIPCCRSCNSKKGSKDWRQFIEYHVTEETNRTQIQTKLSQYLTRYAKVIDIDQIKRELPDEWLRYLTVKEQILALMKEADTIANRIRQSFHQEAEQPGTETSSPRSESLIP